MVRPVVSGKTQEMVLLQGDSRVTVLSKRGTGFLFPLPLLSKGQPGSVIKHADSPHF